MKSKDQYLKQVETYSARNYQPLPVILEKGEGVWVWDTDGKRYLDCLSAYSAVNQGHCHPKIIGALVNQAQKMTLTSRAFHNDQMGAFLEQLCKVAQMEMALPMNTGAEAVETAIKTARKWGYQRKRVPTNQAEIIVCADNFHGRTVTLVSFSTEPCYRDDFGPYTPGFKIVPYGDADAIEKAITPNTVGVMLEPIQGEAGILIPPPGYLKKVQQLCQKNQVLFILDEIQTGLGRTGKMFCYQHEMQTPPDLLILGKALGGGAYPVSAVLASREVLGLFKPGEHGSTFAGNPLGAAVAQAAMSVLIDENLIERARENGDYLLQQLKKISSPHIAEIRGRGLMIGIEIKKSSGKARPFCETLAEHGVLVKETHDQVIRLAPPLVIQKSELDGLVEKLRSVL